MNEAARPKQIQRSVMDESGDESKIRCCKEQYCIGTWNVSQVHESWKIGCGQAGDGKNKHLHPRNQQTKMDENG